MTYEYEGRTEREALEKAAAALGIERDEFDVEILEEQRKSLFKPGYVKIRVHTTDTKHQLSSEFEGAVPNATTQAARPSPAADGSPADEREQKLIDFLATLIHKMGYEATCEAAFREPGKLGIRIKSASSAVLIGRKGKTLDALQLLTNVYATRSGITGLRVVLDTENYRLRREEHLVRLAYATADKVRQRKSAILLEPMNPFERRIIHTTLNDISDIGTESEGEGLYKRVRVFYKGAK